MSVDIPTTRDTWTVCGIRIDAWTRTAALSRITTAIAQGRACRIVTLNPDFLLRARQDRRFAAVLTSADMRLVDGVGIALVARCTGRSVPRYPGADLLDDLLTCAAHEKWRTYVCCNATGLSPWRDVHAALMRRYPGLLVDGADLVPGAPIVLPDGSNAPHLVVCAFGSPAQEYAMAELTDKGVAAVCVGVGGAVDFLTGRVVRAPHWMRRAGIEWVWRTWQQPRRLTKALRSVVFFPLVVLYERMLCSTIR